MYKLLEAAQAITLACGCHARCSSFDAKSYAPPLNSDDPGLPSPPVTATKTLISQYYFELNAEFEMAPQSLFHESVLKGAFQRPCELTNMEVRDHRVS